MDAAAAGRSQSQGGSEPGREAPYEFYKRHSPDASRAPHTFLADCLLRDTDISGPRGTHRTAARALLPRAGGRLGPKPTAAGSVRPGAAAGLDRGPGSGPGRGCPTPEKASGTTPNATRAPSFFSRPSSTPPGSPGPLRRPRGTSRPSQPERPTEAWGRFQPSPLRDSGRVPRPHPPSVTAPSQGGGADQTNDRLHAAARARSLSRASAASRDPRSPHGRYYRPRPPAAVPAAATAVSRLSRLLTGGRPPRASPPPEQTYTKRFPIGSRFPT